MMTVAQVLAAFVGLVVVFWTPICHAVEAVAGRLFSDDHDHPAAPLLGPSYEQAISDLAHVRRRLIDTEGLGDPQKAAIDTLTLALVAGSDKQ